MKIYIIKKTILQDLLRCLIYNRRINKIGIYRSCNLFLIWKQEEMNLVLCYKQLKHRDEKKI